MGIRIKHTQVVQRNIHFILLTSALLYKCIMSFHKPQSLNDFFFNIKDVLNAFLQCSGPFAFRNYLTRSFVNVKRFENILIVCILQSM